MLRERTIGERAETINPKLIVEAVDGAVDAIQAAFSKYKRYSPADVLCVHALLSNALQNMANIMVTKSQADTFITQLIASLGEMNR